MAYYPLKVKDGSGNLHTVGDPRITTADAIPQASVDGLDTALAGKVDTTDARLSDTRTPTDNTVSTAKIVDGAVTSAKIADGTIVNADVSATAAIATSKISGLDSALAAKAPLASPALTGTPTSTTAAADTNTTQIATTAFVAGQAGSATPLVDGTAAVGTSLRYARQDHRHPTDTTRAPLASPALTGTPTAPTAAAGTNTTQIATTAFVTTAVAGASSVPGTGSITSDMIADGTIVNADISASAAIALSKLATGALPTGITVSSTNIVNGTIVDADISASAAIATSKINGLDTALAGKAPLASPTFTGTPAAPTATSGTNTTQIATTAFVQSALAGFTSGPDITLSTSNPSGGSDGDLWIVYS